MSDGQWLVQRLDCGGTGVRLEWGETGVRPESGGTGVAIGKFTCLVGCEPDVNNVKLYHPNDVTCEKIECPQIFKAVREVLALKNIRAFTLIWEATPTQICKLGGGQEACVVVKPQGP